MRLAIDAMGNDKGPVPIVEGAARFLGEDSESTIVLVGREDALMPLYREHGLLHSNRIETIHASQVVEMDDKVSALREKRDSSIMRLVETVKAGGADAMVALGNTAAAVGAATLRLRLLPGVHRAGIAVPLPTANEAPCVVIDMGANTICKPHQLVQYGVMASIYAERVLHVDNPRVGLLNVGEEQSKGNDMLRETFERLERAPIRFVGNVEGGDIYSGACDVVVCDGFTGNVVLKASEGVAEMFKVWLKRAFGSTLAAKIGGLLARPALKRMLLRGSYATYGGAPLLGVNGACIIGHGKSNASAVANALRAARDCVSSGLNEIIRVTLEEKGVGEMAESREKAAPGSPSPTVAS